MPERTPPSAAVLTQPRIGAFVLQGLFWNVMLFALIRLTWVDHHIIASLVGFQQAIVTWYAGAPRIGIAMMYAAHSAVTALGVARVSRACTERE